MPVISKDYYKRQLEIAADLISGRFVPWISVYMSGKYTMCRVSVEQLVRTIDSGLASTMYGVDPNLDPSSLSKDEFNDRVDDGYGIVWIGDIIESGVVICGTLLELVINSARKKINEET